MPPPPPSIPLHARSSFNAARENRIESPPVEVLRVLQAGGGGAAGPRKVEVEMAGVVRRENVLQEVGVAGSVQAWQ